MFGLMLTSGPFMPTAHGPIRIYGTIPTPVVRPGYTMPRMTFVQVGPGFRGPAMIYAGPPLVLRVTRPGALIPILGPAFASGYRGVTRVNSPAPVPRVSSRDPVYQWAEIYWETPGGRTTAFPSKHPLFPPDTTNDVPVEYPRGLPAVRIPRGP